MPKQHCIIEEQLIIWTVHCTKLVYDFNRQTFLAILELDRHCHSILLNVILKLYFFRFAFFIACIIKVVFNIKHFEKFL